MNARPLALALHARALTLLWSARRAYYRLLLGEPTLELYFPVYISPLSNLQVGRHVAISAFVHVIANELVTIGDNTIIASGVQIITSTHDYRVRPYRSKRRDAPVTIGRNVWIGAGAIILPGITLGDDCVIGAGSIVTRNVAPATLVVGSPARPIRTLT